MSQPEKIRERAEDLLVKLRHSSKLAEPSSRETSSTALHIVSELIGTFIAGLLCGLSFDFLVKTPPWGTGTGCLLGIIAGFFGVIRFIRRPHL